MISANWAFGPAGAPGRRTPFVPARIKRQRINATRATITSVRTTPRVLRERARRTSASVRSVTTARGASVKWTHVSARRARTAARVACQGVGRRGPPAFAPLAAPTGLHVRTPPMHARITTVRCSGTSNRSVRRMHVWCRATRRPPARAATPVGVTTPAKSCWNEGPW